MISRDRRTPLSQWWWTVDRLLLAALTTLILGGIILSLAASPPVATRIGLDPFHFFNRHVMFILPAFAVMIGISFLSPRQVRRLGADHVRDQCRAACRDAGVRRRGQGLAPLDLHCSASASRPPSSPSPPSSCWSPGCFRNRRAGRRCPRPRLRWRAAAGRGAAGARAGLRPDHADPDGVGRAVLHGRHAHDLGRRPGRHRDRPDCSAPTCSCRTWRGASSASWIRPPATPSRSIWRRSRLRAAAGSGRGRARARSSASCPTATPTSCSRSRPKSSASSFALRWSRCSPSSCSAR